MLYITYTKQFTSQRQVKARWTIGNISEFVAVFSPL